MKLRFLLMLIASIVFLAPVNAAPVDYQNEIFNYLKLGLDVKSEANYFHLNDYKALQNYLSPLQTDPDFKAYAQQHGWNLKIMAENNWFSATINERQSKIKRLPLYPVQDEGRFTLASFEEQKDDGFLNLPLYMRKYYQKRFQATQEQLKAHTEGEYPTDHLIPAAQLHKELAQLFQEDYWLISPATRQKVKIDSLFCSTYISAGQYQIELKAKNRLPKVLFMFKLGNGREFPKFIGTHVTQSEIPEQFRNNRQLYIASISQDYHLFYIASKQNTAASFQMLWDASKKVIVYLKVGSGFCGGNETSNFTNNTLFQFRGNYYLLRSTDNRRYTEVVYFLGNTLQEICHADYTAPEI